MDKPADYRRLRVQVNRPGLVATARQGFYDRGADDATRAAIPLESFDEAVRTGLAYTGIAMRVAAVSSTNVTLRIRTEDLAWQYGEGDARSSSLYFAALFLDSQGKQLSDAKGPVIVRQLAADYRDRQNAPTEISIAATEPKGAVLLRVLISDSESGKIGSAELRLEAGPRAR